MNAVRAQVRRDRNGEAIDRALLRSIVQLILIMGALESKTDFKTKKDVNVFSRSEAAVQANATYVNDFETPFLRGSEEEFEVKAQGWQATDSVATFLEKADAAIQDEESRCLSFLNPSSKPKLRKGLTRVMIEKRLDWFVDPAGTGLSDMLRQNKLDDIERMYTLVSSVKDELGPQAMAKGIHDYMVAEGAGFVQDRRTALTAVVPDGAAAVGPTAGPSGKAGAEDAKRATPRSKVKKPIMHDPIFVEKLINQHSRF